MHILSRDDFENIPGCVVDEAGCTEVPKTNTRNFLGGCDLRADMGDKNNKLKSIEEFNQSLRAAAQGGSKDIHSVNTESSLISQLKDILIQMGLEVELYDQVVDGIRKQLMTTEPFTETIEAAVVDKAIIQEMGIKLKKAFQAMAVNQLRIK